jgi:hypothetical protein
MKRTMWQGTKGGHLEADPSPGEPCYIVNILVAALWDTLKQKTELNHAKITDRGFFFFFSRGGGDDGGGAGEWTQGH